MKFATVPFSMLLIAVLIGGMMFFSRGSSSPQSGVAPASNIRIVDGTQIVEIDAKGGYEPKSNTAKAGLPTVLRFKTDGTFDCSSVVRIPSMNITRQLPQSGNTDINIGTSQFGTLQGMCGMGMYRFQVHFQS